MATYVTSDAHGHLRALAHAFEMAQPGADDTVFVLGDMIDRGPDPVGVLRLMQQLPNVHVLMGNHESMLVNALVKGDAMERVTWEMNGGFATTTAFAGLADSDRIELLDWLANLPVFGIADVIDRRPSFGGRLSRPYILTHAGIDIEVMHDSLDARGFDASTYSAATANDLFEAMGDQDAQDLLWIRGDFWAFPTGLVDGRGHGPIVVAGHTPSPVLGKYACRMSGRGIDAEGRGLMVEVGACADTGGVADHVCIDCAAAGGSPSGRVGIMRLEDRKTWLVDVLVGE